MAGGGGGPHAGPGSREIAGNTVRMLLRLRKCWLGELDPGMSRGTGHAGWLGTVRDNDGSLRALRSVWVRVVCVLCRGQAALRPPVPI